MRVLELLHVRVLELARVRVLVLVRVLVFVLVLVLLLCPCTNCVDPRILNRHAYYSAFIHKRTDPGRQGICRV